MKKFLGVFLLMCLGCNSIPENDKQRIPPASDRPLLIGEIAVIGFLDRQNATKTLRRWEQNKMVQFEILSYDTDIESGVFRISTKEHPYFFLKKEQEEGWILVFNIEARPEIVWIPE